MTRSKPHSSHARRMGLTTLTLDAATGRCAVRSWATGLGAHPPSAVGADRRVARIATRGEAGGGCCATSSLPTRTAVLRSAGTGSTSHGRSCRVGCECDGFEHHGTRLQWKRDRRRVAAIEATGWRLVHLTWDDVTRRSSETARARRPRARGFRRLNSGGGFERRRSGRRVAPGMSKEIALHEVAVAGADRRARSRRACRRRQNVVDHLVGDQRRHRRPVAASSRARLSSGWRSPQPCASSTTLYAGVEP